MEIAFAQLVGSIIMTIYADWDTKLPKNLEDHYLCRDIQVLPMDRHGLTTMSHCLWRYQILYMQRATTQPDGSRKTLSWMLSLCVPLVDKDAMIDTCERALDEHLFSTASRSIRSTYSYISRSACALSYLLRADSCVNQRGSMQKYQKCREELLKICTRYLECYALSKKTKLLQGF